MGLSREAECWVEETLVLVDPKAANALTNQYDLPQCRDHGTLFKTQDLGWGWGWDLGLELGLSLEMGLDSNLHLDSDWGLYSSHSDLGLYWDLGSLDWDLGLDLEGHLHLH